MHNFQENLDGEKKNNIKSSDKKRKKVVCEVNKQNREEIFCSVQSNNIVDPCILHAEAFKLIADDFTTATKEGPTYICDTCWKFE